MTCVTARRRDDWKTTAPQERGKLLCWHTFNLAVGEKTQLPVTTTCAPQRITKSEPTSRDPPTVVKLEMTVGLETETFPGLDGGIVAGVGVVLWPVVPAGGLVVVVVVVVGPSIVIEKLVPGADEVVVGEDIVFVIAVIVVAPVVVGEVVPVMDVVVGDAVAAVTVVVGGTVVVAVSVVVGEVVTVMDAVVGDDDDTDVTGTVVVPPCTVVVCCVVVSDAVVHSGGRTRPN